MDETVRVIETLTNIALGRQPAADLRRESMEHRQLRSELENVRLNADVDVMPQPPGSMQLLKRSVLRLGAFNWVRQRAVNQSLAHAIQLLAEEISDLHQRLDARTIDDESRRRVDQPTGSIDDLYVRFEDAFRPGGDELRARYAEYLPDLRALPDGERPVLDIGAGRGDFLAVLAEAGIAAIGVDSNADAVADANERGLHVIHGDALSYLRSLEPMSLGAVTAFHVIEHVEPEVAVALIDGAMRALAPGGLFIVETPNPTNLNVGGAAFYDDPTHLRPVPPKYLEWLVRDRGFVEVTTRFLHPVADAIDSAELDGWPDHVTALLDDVHWALKGPQDFAVLGRRPDRA